MQAYAWLELAASRGLEPARRFQTSLSGKMTPAQLTEARALSVELEERVSAE